MFRSWFTVLEPKKKLKSHCGKTVLRTPLYGAEETQKTYWRLSVLEVQRKLARCLQCWSESRFAPERWASFPFEQCAETVLHERSVCGVFAEMEKLIKIAMIIQIASVTCEMWIQPHTNKNRIKNWIHTFTELYKHTQTWCSFQRQEQVCVCVCVCFWNVVVKWTERKQRRRRRATKCHLR